MSAPLATAMAELSRELSRKVGVLIDRRGNIQHVVVGDRTRMFLPDIGRLRGASGRFRGLRVVHTRLDGEGLSREDLTDLTLLRFDLVATFGVTEEGLPRDLFVGHLVPPNPENRLWERLPPSSVHHQDIDVPALMAALEAEFARTAHDAKALNGQTQAVLVQVAPHSQRDTEARIHELRELCRTADVAVLDTFAQRRPGPDPKFLVGRGKLEQILLRAMQLGADALIFDQNLTPAQARAVSEFTDLKILDRTMLILDIFAQHAKSRDGKLQVELAQLRYALPRLIAKNTMMSRLTGGIGGRGPGETKLEINRRRARDRIRLLEKQLANLSKNRRTRRERRDKRNVPIVAIVGYTNAGKSTLLNALTQGNALSEDKLFATLDPISRRLRFPREREVVLTDTVGFIRDLPPDLVEAFRATLEELADADLLIHVVDGSDDDQEQHVSSVEGLLYDLALADKPRVVVYNKSDKSHGAQRGICVSALAPDTFGPLLTAIEDELWAAATTG